MSHDCVQTAYVDNIMIAVFIILYYIILYIKLLLCCNFDSEATEFSNGSLVSVITLVVCIQTGVYKSCECYLPKLKQE